MGMRENEGQLSPDDRSGKGDGRRTTQSTAPPQRAERTDEDFNRQAAQVHDERRAVDRETRAGASTMPTPTIERNEGVTARRDRIRWGPLWAGVVVAVGVYLLLQLTWIATGAIELGTAETADAWLSALAALIAFFVGALTTGASAIWDKIEDGILHGVVLWAIAVTALLVLSVFGGGLALGALDATGAFEDVQVDLEEGTIEGLEGVGAEDAEEAASWVLLGLGAALLAAVLGGVAGAKLWPRTEEIEVDRRERTGAGAGPGTSPGRR